MLSFSTLLSRSLRLSPNSVLHSSNSSLRVTTTRRNFADQRPSTSAEEEEGQGRTSTSTTAQEERSGSERAESNVANLPNALTDLPSSSSTTPPSSCSSSSLEPSSQWSTLSSQITQEEHRVNAERAERRRREEEMSRVRAEKERVEGERVEKARETIRLRRLASTTTRTPVSEPTSPSSSSSPPPPPLLSTTPKTRSSRVSKLSSNLTSTITSERSPFRPTTSSPGGKVKVEANFQRITSDEWALIELVRGAKVKPSMVSMEMFLKRLQSSDPTTSSSSHPSTISAPPSSRYTFSSDPLLNTPTAAHFADPASRTVFLGPMEQSRWTRDFSWIQMGRSSRNWKEEDEPSVKMRKSWEAWTRPPIEQPRAMRAKQDLNNSTSTPSTTATISISSTTPLDPSSSPTAPVEPSGPNPLLRLLGLKGRAESS